MITLASASGNVFAYVWEQDALVGFEGSAWARSLCPRGEGLGVDGLFLLRPPEAGQPWKLDHWDPDGSLSFCSNGTRAAAALLPEACQGMVPAQVSGEEVLLRRQGTWVGLRMPQGPAYGLQPVTLEVPLPHAYGWTGTPHLILEVPDTEAVDLPTFGPPLRHHPALPQGANVSIVEILHRGRARIRTWERGVENETLCCGQGCAVAAAWLQQRTGEPGWTFQPRGRDPVHVEGHLTPDGHWQELWLSGPVRILGRLTPGADLVPEGSSQELHETHPSHPLGR